MNREAFEAWAAREYPNWTLSPKTASGEYASQAAKFAWAVWQAATAHARDVAAEIVLHELDGNGQAEAINIAIKEALK